MEVFIKHFRAFYFLTLVFIILLIPSFALSSSDFIKKNTQLEITGLSPKYEKYFKKEFKDLLTGMSSSDLFNNKKFFPILITVDYKDGSGLISMEIHYSPKDKYVQPVYQNFGDTSEIYLVFQNRMLLGLRNYLIQVAGKSEDYSLPEKFDIALRMVKDDGSVFICFANGNLSQSYNLFLGQMVNFYTTAYLIAPTKTEVIDNSVLTRVKRLFKINVPPSYTYSTVKYKIENRWNDQTGSPRFLFGRPYDIDGKETNSYWFYKFFEIPIPKGKE